MFTSLDRPAIRHHGVCMIRCSCFLLLALSTLRAAPVSESVSYALADKTFECTLAYDPSHQNARGAVFIVPNWRGPSAYFTAMAERIAGWGYVGFVADVYGASIRPETDAEAGAQASALLGGDRALVRERLKHALKTLQAQPQVDAERIVAIGFCFGGSCVLEMARSGLDLRGVVSLHGGLTTPQPLQPDRFTGEIMVLHGDADPLVPPEDVADFQAEMRAAQADWELVAFGRAVHSFTNPEARAVGFAHYDADAAQRSWALMKDFFAEHLGEAEGAD